MRCETAESRKIKFSSISLLPDLDPDRRKNQYGSMQTEPESDGADFIRIFQAIFLSAPCGENIRVPSLSVRR